MVFGCPGLLGVELLEVSRLRQGEDACDRCTGVPRGRAQAPLTRWSGVPVRESGYLSIASRRNLVCRSAFMSAVFQAQ
ncbi:hypothetical protein GCM10009730_50970 [Streptomyces albidochromogenes]